MTLYGTLALLCFLGVIGCQLANLMIRHQIIEAINKARPGEEPLDFFGFFPRPMSDWQVFSIYRTCYPKGPLLVRYWLVTAGGILSFALTVFFAWRAAA